MAAPLAVGALGLLMGGSGLLNGDAAAYVAQGWQGNLSERWVHLGYLLLACAAGWTGAALPRLLDAVSALCGAALVAAGRGEGRFVVAGAVLPWVAFAEVDLPWMALVVLAVELTSPWMAGAVLAAAVTVSPMALLAAPWVAIERGQRGVLLGPVVAVALLMAVSGGDWLWGDRGLLMGPQLPGRTLEAWARSGVWLLPAFASDRRWVALAPLLLGPPDVPGWVLLAAALGRRWPTGGLARGVGIAAIVAGLWGLGDRRARVAAEDRMLREVAAALQEGQVIEAPWSLGARLSVLSTGSVYGARWVAIPPVRDQAICPAIEVGRLPPGRGPAERVDERGVGWLAAGCDPSRTSDAP